MFNDIFKRMKSLLVLLSILFLAGLGISQISKTEKPPVSDKWAQVISDDEYRIYESLFSEWFGKDNLALMVINPSLHSCKGAAYMVESKYSKVSDATTDEIEANCVDLPAAKLLNANQFHLKQKVVLVTEDQQKSYFPSSVDCEVGWKKYFKKYPRSNGFMSVSRVGFDREKHYAAVYFSYIRGCLDGEGHKVLLENVNGHWKVIYHLGLWMV
jgi:hypothetical protein